jgi:hypothetical protein
LINCQLKKSPIKSRPSLQYNKYDNKYQIDRTSVVSYPIEEGLPLFPYGRTGVRGRNIFFYWGPNKAVQIMLTRSNADSDFEVLVVKNKDNTKLSLPYV